jgi:cytochrome c oxidase assembly protein subunit 15
MGGAGGSQDGASRARARRFAQGFTALLVLAYGLIVLGALVRAHGAGLSCPDWPLCFGVLVPTFDFHVAFEWGHRLVAGTVSLVFLALAVGVVRDPALRAAAGRPVGIAAALLALQVVLGGLTVLHLLASWTVTSHLVTGNAFAATLLWIVLRLRARAAGVTPADEAVTPALRALVATGAALLALQIVLGGLVSSRYAGLACAQWPACNDGIFLPTFEGVVGLQLAHRLNGYALALAIAITATAARGVAPLERPTALALGLVLLQIALGVANVWLRIPVEITALHSATAAALVLTQTVCVRNAWGSAFRAHDVAPARSAAAEIR